MDSGPNDHLRVSDAERAKVGQLLERAVAEGMITLDEFSERYDAALAARTRGELSRRGGGPADCAALDGRGIPPRAAAPEELRGWMSSIVRRGQWRVAPALHLNTRLCSTTLDFTSAVLPEPGGGGPHRRLLQYDRAHRAPRGHRRSQCSQRHRRQRHGQGAHQPAVGSAAPRRARPRADGFGHRAAPVRKLAAAPQRHSIAQRISAVTRCGYSVRSSQVNRSTCQPISAISFCLTRSCWKSS